MLCIKIVPCFVILYGFLGLLRAFREKPRGAGIFQKKGIITAYYKARNIEIFQKIV